jgi:hypothetical protein
MTTLSVALIAIGMLILFDYHRIPSRFTSLVDKWWKAGPIRRRFKPRGPIIQVHGRAARVHGTRDIRQRYVLAASSTADQAGPWPSIAIHRHRHPSPTTPKPLRARPNDTSATSAPSTGAGSSACKRPTMITKDSRHIRPRIFRDHGTGRAGRGRRGVVDGGARGWTFLLHARERGCGRRNLSVG